MWVPALALCALGQVLAGGEVVAEWRFDAPEILEAWVPNAHMSDVAAVDGAVEGVCSDWDPFFTNRSMEIAAGPNQYVILRMQSDAPGRGELFWSGTMEGEHGGLSADKVAQFTVRGGEEWQDVVIAPGWRAEGTVRQMRLDLWQGIRFRIVSIRVVDASEGREPQREGAKWSIGETGDLQPLAAGSHLFVGPPLSLNPDEIAWAGVRATATEHGVMTLLWQTDARPGLQEHNVTLRGDGTSRVYNIEVQGLPGWSGTILGLALRTPDDGSVTAESLELGAEPFGSPEIEVTRFGFENAPNRAGLPCNVHMRLTNASGGIAKVSGVTLEAPEGLRIGQAPEADPAEGLGFSEHLDLIWEVTADAPGDYDVTGVFLFGELRVSVPITLTFTAPPAGAGPADYVPEPRPIETDIAVCAYYFPGWNADVKWDCIRRVAPVRKPVLGYYDEGDPEIVDWQIKWAVENGISCFLVDWYWSDGAQMLTHWFEAYREARYRDHLDVAIMWANHNAPGSHSVEDWRKVNREWIDRYFNLPGYYRIDGKPAVFIWDPEGIRNDVGGEDVVRAMLEESQRMAREAGYEGVTFVALRNDFTAPRLEMLVREGYQGITTYHEWGVPDAVAGAPNRQTFESVVKSAPDAWRDKQASNEDLVYYPVVDTGWDSRPWHGDRSYVITGRTPALFEDLLVEAKAYCGARELPFVVLGPLNEWGEGSYIEPAVEYGFEMYEAIRRVFGKGDPASWPENIAPCDVGLGPYAFAPMPLITEWAFDSDDHDWQAAMNVADVRAEDGALRLRSTAGDPALMVMLNDVAAEDYVAIEVTMTLTHPTTAASESQAFWSFNGFPITEATSVRIPVQLDGVSHVYRYEVGDNPRWRGRIASLRFDPCDVAGAQIAIDHVRLVPADEAP